jgi:hypothetical protein
MTNCSASSESRDVSTVDTRRERPVGSMRNATQEMEEMKMTGSNTENA